MKLPVARALGAVAFAKKIFRSIRMSSWHSSFGTTTNPTRHLFPLQIRQKAQSHLRKSQRPSPGALFSHNESMEDPYFLENESMEEKLNKNQGPVAMGSGLLRSSCMGAKVVWKVGPFFFMEAVCTELTMDANFDRMESLESS